MTTKKIHILGGGTFNHVRAHLALAAPAFGGTARKLDQLIRAHTGVGFISATWKTQLHLTKMADHHSDIVTNEDVENLVDKIITDRESRMVIFNVALCDYEGSIGYTPSGKYKERLKTADGQAIMVLTPAEKLIKRIRKERKDIFLIAFKTTAGASEDEQYLAGLNLLKSNSCNLVLANDLITRKNMIIVPEEARYDVTTDRDHVMFQLVKMAISRAELHFTRSTVVPGETVRWWGNEVPDSLRTVVNHCISRGAYKPFRGNTAGHFAYKVDDKTFITSKRKTNYNNLNEVGLVKVVSSNDDEVIAYGAKPSVGGQSQRIVFAEHPDVDCIVHFHCPTKPGVDISTRPQKYLECGSHECGKNTSDGLELYEDGIKAVFLDEHGPNIVFNRNVDPMSVIDFIERNFDLTAKTGGLVV